MKTSRLKTLIIITIILIPVSLVVRIIFGRELQAWEGNLIASWGIPRLKYDLAKIGVLIGIAVFFLIRRKQQQKKDDSRYYKLPKS